MECAYYFASWNGISFNSQPQAYLPIRLQAPPLAEGPSLECIASSL